jgi:hypothetical protein
MSTKVSVPTTASQAPINRASAHRDKAFSDSRGMLIRTKVIIAAIALLFALLYAIGVTLMIDATETPSTYTTFLRGAD